MLCLPDMLSWVALLLFFVSVELVPGPLGRPVELSLRRPAAGSPRDAEGMLWPLEAEWCCWWPGWWWAPPPLGPGCSWPSEGEAARMAADCGGS